MRLLDGAITSKRVVLGFERETVDLPAQSSQLHLQRYVGRRDRLVVLIGISAKFRIDAVLEDRDLNGECARAQHATAMRPLFIVVTLLRLLSVGIRRRTIAASKQAERAQNNKGESARFINPTARHHRFPFTPMKFERSPVSRAIAATSVW